MEIKQAGCVLTQQGRTLYLTKLNNQKKFKNIGNIEGAKAGARTLEDAGLGKLDIEPCHRGTSEVQSYFESLLLMHDNFHDH